jgi:pimeloyl-ACP methyl ester carboxylesterase
VPAANHPHPPTGEAERQDRDWGHHHHWHWRGLRCHWRVLGAPEAPPLLLIHGFAAGSGHWRFNAQPLAAAGWRVYGLDLIGFGDSSQPRLRLDNRLWARQVQGFLEEVVGQPAVLVGHSLGGLVVLSCSVFFPHLVRAAVACPLPDPSLLMGPPNRRPPWRRQLQRWLVRWLCRLLPLELIVPLLAHSPLLALGIQAAYHGPVLGDHDLHQLIAGPARRAGAVLALRAMSIAMALRPPAATATALLPRLRRPLLLIWGRQDRLVPLDVARQCRRLRPDLPLKVLAPAGHCPHDEAAEAFNQTLLTWLAQQGLEANTPREGSGTYLGA